MRIAKWLVLATLLYNVAEGIIAIWAGVRAGSISLVAFGADSYLEVAAAAVVLWRLGIADSECAEAVEDRAVQFIGWTFLALAAAIVYQSAWSLAAGGSAGESLIGIGLAAASVIVMPGIAFLKLRAAARGNIPVLAVEAKETLACSYLSLTLLIGLLVTALLGWWWLDAVTALLLTPWLIREGLEGIRGEACAGDVRPCSCRGCLYGLRACRLPRCAGA